MEENKQTKCNKESQICFEVNYPNEGKKSFCFDLVDIKFTRGVENAK